MAPHFRQCHFCSNSSTESPNVVIFTANEKLKKVLNVSPISVKLICEEHFLPEDVKTHGDTKRLVDGATPKFFPTACLYIWLFVYLFGTGVPCKTFEKIHTKSSKD